MGIQNSACASCCNNANGEMEIKNGVDNNFVLKLKHLEPIIF